MTLPSITIGIRVTTPTNLSMAGTKDFKRIHSFLNLSFTDPHETPQIPIIGTGQAFLCQGDGPNKSFIGSLDNRCFQIIYLVGW